MNTNEINAILRKHIDPVRVQMAIRVLNEVKQFERDFNIKAWIKRDGGPSGCGFSACLMGWMGQDAECRATGFVCDESGPTGLGTGNGRAGSEYNFFLKKDVDIRDLRYIKTCHRWITENDVIVQEINGVIYESGYIDEIIDGRYRLDHEITPDMVIEKLMNLLAITEDLK